jgi:endonuclease YncB( thermonuclease family)
VSKHFTPPAAKKVTVRRSIRREPVPLAKKVEPRSDEVETLMGMAGVLSIAAAMVALIVGIAWVTYSRFDPAAAAAAKRFGQCYNWNGPNCVIDGDTIQVNHAVVEVAGLEAPRIDGARCEAERTRGIQAAVRLADLLNSGAMSVSAPTRDPSGREVRTVLVKGEDVRFAMLEADLARRPGTISRKWC